MGENFQPIIFIEWGSVAQYPGMFLQGNLQFFIRSDAGLTYIGMTNLFNVATGGLHISALRGNITAGTCPVLLLMRAMTALILQFILTFQVQLLMNIQWTLVSSCTIKILQVLKIFTSIYRDVAISASQRV